MKTTVLLASIALALCGCEDHTEGKPKAEVSSAAPASTPAPQASTETTSVEELAIDQEQSTIAFVGAKVTGSHEGTIEKFTGNVELKNGKPELSKVSVTLDMTSVEVEPEKLQKHLLSEDFFHSEKYEQAVFTSTNIRPGGKGEATHTITGSLTLRGKRKTISFPATIEVEDDAVKATAEFSINRKDFGIVYPGMPDDLIKDDVLIKLDIQAPRKKS